MRFGMAFEISDFLEGKTRIPVGAKYARTVLRFVDQAQDMFEPDQAVEAKEWVRVRLLSLAAETDIRWLPNWIETPIEKLLVNLAVELGWELLHSQELRRGIVRSARID